MALAVAIDTDRGTAAMRIDPCLDQRWHRFVDRHPDALVFHSPGWLRSIVSAFGYEPRAYILTDETGEIKAGWPAMLIRSRLTGSRIVGLPFSHCAGPLTGGSDGPQLLELARQDAEDVGGRWIECRGWPAEEPIPTDWACDRSFSEHLLDLRAGPDAALRRADKDVRYSVRRAEREGVSTRLASSMDDVRTFYGLYQRLRKRQGLLPQPLTFIESVYREIVEPGNGFIVLADYDGEPITGLLSVGFGTVVVGTHSGSSPAGRRLRANHLAVMKSIQTACERGYERYNLGRTDVDSQGLMQFKKDWGAEQVAVPYVQYPPGASSVTSGASQFKRTIMREFCRITPDGVFAGVGSRFYRHLG